MSDAALALSLLASKPLVYSWMFELLRRRLPAPDRPSGSRSLAAGVLRFCLGAPLGIMGALLLSSLGPVGYAFLLAARLATWTWIAATFLPPLSWRGAFRFGAAATTANVLLDFSLASLSISC